MKSKIILFTLTFLLFLYGCSTHQTSLENEISKDSIYEIDEQQVFQLVYSSIQEVFPEENISVITFPTRGYVTKFLAPPFHIDWYTQQIMIHRASGITPEGKKKYGYWIEVSGSGSSFVQGQLKNDEVFDKIIGYLESSAKKHNVTNIANAPYLVNKENFYVRNGDTLEGKGSRVIITNRSSEHQTQTNKLRELHQLKEDGILTEEEFNTAKKKILDGL